MPFQGGLISARCRRARDEDARQVEQQRRVLVAARVQPGQRHQQFAAAQIGIADQVEGGIGRDEAVPAERAAADARRRCGSRRRSWRAPAAAPLGLAPAAAVDATSSMVSSSSATGWPTAAQSGSASSRARVSASAVPAGGSRRAVRAGRPGAAAPAAADCRARSGRIWRDARRRRGRSAAAGRRRRRATARPSGPSARGRRLRRCRGNSSNSSRVTPPHRLQCSGPRRPDIAPEPARVWNAIRSDKNYKCDVRHRCD